MKQFHILVIDDEPDIRESVKDILEDEGFKVSVASDGKTAREQAGNANIDLALLDIWMPDEDGISLLRYWRRDGDLPFPVVVMSGHATIDSAVEATRLGASTFIEKPLTTTKLLLAINHVLPGMRAVDGPVRIPAGTSRIAQSLREQAKAVSHTDQPLMIYGPKGIGKTDFAFYVYTMSAQAKKSFVVIDEAQTVSDLSPPAQWGVLLIKNIGMHSEVNQRALADKLREYKDKHADFRLMVSDQKDLQLLTKQRIIHSSLAELLAEGQTVYMPSLNERIGDIPDLIGACVDYHCQTSSLPYRRFSIAAQNFLLHHSWSDNMRELDSLVERLLKRGKSNQITLEEVRTAMRESGANDNDFGHMMQMPLRDAREEFERRYLEHHLREVDGNVTRLAASVGVERTHLYRKLKSLGINFGDNKELQ